VIVMCRFQMSLLLPVLGLAVTTVPLFQAPAWAADQPKACAAPARAVRQTWQQHFQAADLAHDGHLTLEEAKGGYPDAAKHFDDIDVDHKGYLTENDLRAWQVMRKAAHRLSKPPEDKLRPRSAVQRVYPDFRTITAAGKPTPTRSTGSASVRTEGPGMGDALTTGPTAQTQ
jgi:hypothetical protein